MPHDLPHRPQRVDLRLDRAYAATNREEPAMKRTVAATLACIAISTTACTATTTGHPATLTAADPAVTQSVYLKTLQQAFPGSSAHDLLKLGRSVCSALDVGGDWLGVLKSLLDGGLKAKQSGELIASAVATMCPQYLDELPGGSKFSR